MPFPPTDDATIFVSRPGDQGVVIVVTTLLPVFATPKATVMNVVWIYVKRDFASKSSRFRFFTAEAVTGCSVATRAVNGVKRAEAVEGFGDELVMSGEGVRGGGYQSEQGVR